MADGKFRLSDRLETIASHVAPGETAADIGTDHGYIPIRLISGGITDRVILTDIRQGPLDKAKKNFARWLPGTAPDLRRGPGLSVLKPGEAEVLIIAGMGGILIRRILTEDPDVVRSARTLVLQPRNHAFTLRQYLRMLDGFTVTDEQVVRERRLYSEIITLRRTDLISEEEKKRAAEVKEAERILGLDERVYDELPVMIALKGNYTDYIERKCRAEIRVIENILSHGHSEYADKRLRRAEGRLAAFRSIQHFQGGLEKK